MHNKQSNTKHCNFCVNNQLEIDYKDWQQIQKYVSSYGKITPKRRNGVCSKHQRKLAQVIKRARFMALLPFVSR
ncbi:MAG: 30S ribosomal protein S18 [Patescibacteria group bacterium]|jgi:small subunit ribosomal protein S18